MGKLKYNMFEFPHFITADIIVPKGLAHVKVFRGIFCHYIFIWEINRRGMDEKKYKSDNDFIGCGVGGGNRALFLGV